MGLIHLNTNQLGRAVGYGCCCYCQVTSVVSDSVRPHGLQPTRLPRPWDSPGKSTGVGAIAFSDGCWAPFIYLCLVLSVTNLTSSALILFGKLDTWAIKWVNATTAWNLETEGLVYCLLQKVLSPSPKDPGIRFVWLREELPSTESLPET